MEQAQLEKFWDNLTSYQAEYDAELRIIKHYQDPARYETMAINSLNENVRYKLDQFMITIKTALPDLIRENLPLLQKLAIPTTIPSYFKYIEAVLNILFAAEERKTILNTNYAAFDNYAKQNNIKCRDFFGKAKRQALEYSSRGELVRPEDIPSLIGPEPCPKQTKNGKFCLDECRAGTTGTFCHVAPYTSYGITYDWDYC